MSRREIGAGCGLALATIILMLPGVGTLEPIGVRALAIIVRGVVFWATDVLNAEITTVMTMGLLMIAGVPGSVALSGLAASGFWILVAVLFFGCAMDRTGLAPRTDAPPTRHPLCDTGPRLAVRDPVSIDGIIRPRDEMGDLGARGCAAGVALGGARVLERRI